MVKLFLFSEGTLTRNNIQNRNTCIYGDLLVYNTESVSKGDIASEREI
jgi:hypothetical protein